MFIIEVKFLFRINKSNWIFSVEMLFVNLEIILKLIQQVESVLYRKKKMCLIASIWKMFLNLK